MASSDMELYHRLILSSLFTSFPSIDWPVFKRTSSWFLDSYKQVVSSVLIRALFIPSLQRHRMCFKSIIVARNMYIAMIVSELPTRYYSRLKRLEIQIGMNNAVMSGERRYMSSTLQE